MNKRIEQVLASSLAAGFCAVTEEQHASAAEKTDPANVQNMSQSVPAGRNFKALGTDDAREIQIERTKADSFARIRILERAKELGGLPSGNDWLLGYADYFSTDKNNQTRKTRLSEARAIFSAWVGPHANGVTLDEARAKLENYAGGYGDFVKLCRDLRATNSTGRPDGAVAKNVTTKQMDTVEKAIPLMNVVQALDVAKKSTMQLAKTTNGEIALLRKLISADFEVLRKSDDEGIRTFAEMSSERAQQIVSKHELMEQRAREEAKAQESGTTTHLPAGEGTEPQQAAPATPTPASEGTVETPAAEPVAATAEQQQVANG